MSAEAVVTVAFLLVSMLGLGVQAWALGRLWRTVHLPGLVRTAACRVGCAALYVAVGVNAWGPQWAVLQASFIAFCVTQATWQINALMDVRLDRRRGRRPLPNRPPLKD